ncbi:hypothetical protein [Amycolatopsis sp. lyj-23]|uniref:hypothetical protein n=1 Tax=Amycolatopsis sp. lyj-23 TaxID=2789283 RepID=UPI0039786FE9
MSSSGESMPVASCATRSLIRSVPRVALGLDDLGDQLFQHVRGFADLAAVTSSRLDSGTPSRSQVIAIGGVGEVCDQVAVPARFEGVAQPVGHVLAAFAQLLCRRGPNAPAQARRNRVCSCSRC